MKPIKVSVFQFDVLKGRIKENLEKVLSTAKRSYSEILVLPEMWSCGFDYENLKDHALKSPEIIEELSQIAEKQNLIIIGSLPEYSEGRIYNSISLIDNRGNRSIAYRKSHLFTVGYEDRNFVAGDKLFAAETDFGVLGFAICYDLRFPELARSLMQKGVQIFIVSAQWPALRKEHWRTLLWARAIENQFFVVAANRCGRDGELVYGGGSLIVSPLDNIIAELGDKEGLASAFLDFSLMEDYRKRIPCLKERRPEIYDPSL